jgi:hypothetical protein
MSTDLPEPERWCNLPDRGETAEEALGATFRRVREATEPLDAAVARVTRRINAATRSPRGQLIWRVVLVAILIMATGGVVGAALSRWRRAVASAPQSHASADSPIRSSEVRKRRHRSHALHAIEPLDAVDAVDAVDPVAALDPLPPVVAPPSLAPLSPPSSPSPSSFLRASPTANVRRVPERRAPPIASTEARLLASAFLQLRSSGDAAAALQSLDQYDRRFPEGVLHDEARIARVEALLTLDRHAEALRLLEAMGGGGGGLTRDVRITRAELLVESGRCTPALRDFDAILAAREDDAPGGRALYGRASCQSRAGDIQAARRDLSRYLSLYPDGPSAAVARRALNSLP